MLVVIGFLLILFLEAARRQRKEALVLEYQYRLFAVRDDLREYAIEDPPVAQNWVFQYLDSTIAKSISLLPTLSIWRMLGLLLTYRNDPRLEKFRKHLEEEFGKPENRRHKEIEERFLRTLGEFIVSRHILMLVLSVSALVLPAAIATAMQEVKKRSLELVAEAPETSTLHRFAPSY